jgi:hypothetical protein
MTNRPMKRFAAWEPVVKDCLAAVLMSLLLLAVLGFGTTARAELPVITGENWTATDNDSKLAFLMGIATMVKAEQNLIGDPPPAGTVSYAPAIAKGIGDMTLTEIVTRLDGFYAANPDNINKAVVTVISETIVVPNLEANK